MDFSDVFLNIFSNKTKTKNYIHDNICLLSYITRKMMLYIKGKSLH